MKRSLILAGGGLKVAFQAGVLQVWLDEADLHFDHVDAASGGVFNLAMLCQGMTGTQIADAWRTYRPLDAMSLNLTRFPLMPAFTLEGLRRRVFPRWALDWEAIRSSKLEATFNVYNFSKHRLAVLGPHEMTEDHLVAAVSLPMWFPPVEIGGDWYIDAVYVTDGNVEEAVRRGADEVWLVWTVSRLGEWRDGFLRTYFQIIEAAANGTLARDLDRIERSNFAIAAGEHAPYDRPIAVERLVEEVPLNYLIQLSSDRVARAVNLGVARARRWCADNKIAFTPTPDPPDDGTSLRFTETMRGFVGFGERDPVAGAPRGRADGTALSFRLTIRIDGVSRFVRSAKDEARAEGVVRCDALGGTLRVERGVFNLFAEHPGDPTRARMLYRLYVRDVTGRPLTIAGFKEIRDDPGPDLWTDTTTLYLRVLAGHVDATAERAAPVVASGVLTLGKLDFARQLTTLRVDGPTRGARSTALERFGALFAGKLWDVYGRRALAWSPF